MSYVEIEKTDWETILLEIGIVLILIVNLYAFHIIRLLSEVVEGVKVVMLLTMIINIFIWVAFLLMIYFNYRPKKVRLKVKRGKVSE